MSSAKIRITRQKSVYYARKLDDELMCIITTSCISDESRADDEEIFEREMLYLNTNRTSRCDAARFQYQ